MGSWGVLRRWGDGLCALMCLACGFPGGGLQVFALLTLCVALSCAVVARMCLCTCVYVCVRVCLSAGTARRLTSVASPAPLLPPPTVCWTPQSPTRTGCSLPTRYEVLLGWVKGARDVLLGLQGARCVVGAAGGTMNVQLAAHRSSACVRVVLQGSGMAAALR